MYALTNFLTFLWYGAAQATGSGFLDGTQVAGEALETCPDGVDVHSHFQRLLAKRFRERAGTSYVEQFRRFAAMQASQEYSLPSQEGVEKGGPQNAHPDAAPRLGDRRDQPLGRDDQPGDKRGPGRPPRKSSGADFGSGEQRP